MNMHPEENSGKTYPPRVRGFNLRDDRVVHQCVKLVCHVTRKIRLRADGFWSACAYNYILSSAI